MPMLDPRMFDPATFMGQQAPMGWLNIPQSAGFPQQQVPQQQPQQMQPPMDLSARESMAPQQPGIFGAIGNGLGAIGNGIANNPMTLMALGAGIMEGGFGKGLKYAIPAAQADQKTKQLTATEQALIKRGLTPDVAKVAAGNPALIQAILQNDLGLKATTDDIKAFEYAKKDGFKGGFTDWMERKGTRPTYGVIGKDQFGNEKYGWIDPANRTTTPNESILAPAQSAPGASLDDSVVIPPGMNPKVWRDTVTKKSAEAAVKAPEIAKQEKKVADIVIQDIDRSIKEIDNAILPASGFGAEAIAKIGGTAASNVAALTKTIKSNAGFAELQKMRNNSPTGGSLGNVSNKEVEFLQSTIGNLEQSQTDAQLKDNLRRVKNTYLDIIHGPGNGPPREKLGFETSDKPAQKTKSGVTWSFE